MSGIRDKCDKGSPPSKVSSSNRVTPMAIPFASAPVPPPLPPPKFLPEFYGGIHEPDWTSGKNDGERSILRKERGHGSVDETELVIQPTRISNPALGDGQRRKSSLSTLLAAQDQGMRANADIRPNGNDNTRMPHPNAELRGEQELRQRNVEQSSQSYDKQLLSRIGGPNASKLEPLSFTPAVLLENGHIWKNAIEQQSSFVPAPSTGELRSPSYDPASSIRWPNASAIWSESGVVENDSASNSRHDSIASIDPGSHRGSYDQSMFMSDEFQAGEGQMRKLHIQDQSPSSPKAGSKRRASSPPRERQARSSVTSAPVQGEIQQRQSLSSLPHRISPVSRAYIDPSSLSSASSTAPRHGSLGSSLGPTSVPSSATSYTSNGLSPSSLSRGFDMDRRHDILFSDIDRAGQSPSTAHHQRALSESGPSTTRKFSVDALSHPRQNSLSQLQGMYVCECCPKKPRKFDTKAELRQHENEKQYACAYCSNRFKNKNEAERHQNSLHLRSHSWSCSALPGKESAFQTSPSTKDSDMCGYCGRDFPNPPQWDVRTEHLHHVHKFVECNQAKKFFRADHFRQHLKHSHQGTSGKWTTILENACMKDEPLPQKRMSPIAVTDTAGQTPSTLMSNGLSGPGPPPVNDTIEETPHDS